MIQADLKGFLFYFKLKIFHSRLMSLYHLRTYSRRRRRSIFLLSKLYIFWGSVVHFIFYAVQYCLELHVSTSNTIYWFQIYVSDVRYQCVVHQSNKSYLVFFPRSLVKLFISSFCYPPFIWNWNRQLCHVSEQTLL